MGKHNVATVFLVLAVALAFTAQQAARADGGMSPSSVSPDLLSRSWAVDPGALPPSEAKCISGEWPAVRGTSDEHPNGDNGQRSLDFARAKAVAPAGWDEVWYYISGTPTAGKSAGLVGCINQASLMVLRHQAAATALSLSAGADASPLTKAEVEKALAAKVNPLAGRVEALEKRDLPTRDEFADLNEKVSEYKTRLSALEKALSITGAYVGVQATTLPMNHRAVEWQAGFRILTFIPHTRVWGEMSGGKPIRSPEEGERLQTGAGTIGLSWRVPTPLGAVVPEVGAHQRQFQDSENWAVYQLRGFSVGLNWAPPLWSWVSPPKLMQKTEGLVSARLYVGNATDFRGVEAKQVGFSLGLQGSFGH